MHPLEKIKIFLVDDDEMFVNSLKHSLSGEKIEITSFTNGEECIRHMDEYPKIVVLDYALNESMNGVQVLNQIKHTSPDTNIIMLSGIDNKSIIKDTMKYGAYDFIEKDESAVHKLKKEIKALCDEIELEYESKKEDKKLLKINAGIIILIVLAFILTHIK